MIPREILKKIQQIELRTNRLVTELADAAVYESQRDSRPKAQGCEERVTLGQRPADLINRKAVVANPFSSAARGICHNPVGVDENLIPFTQGSSCVATLGWIIQSLSGLAFSRHFSLQPSAFGLYMIPREILKKIRQIELRTNRLVTETLAGQYHSVFKGQGMNSTRCANISPATTCAPLIGTSPRG